MARNSEARSALRSYMPVSTLVRKGDFDALSFKFQAKGHNDWDGAYTDRELALASLSAYRGNRDPEGVKSVHDVDFNGASLEIGSETPILGHDSKHGVVLSGDSDEALLLHVNYLRGPQHIRRELGSVASYIASNQELRETPLVLGVTYREMASLGLRLGMRPLEIDEIDSGSLGNLESTYALAFPEKHAEGWFKPAAVYLPTDEFVDRFGHN